MCKRIITITFLIFLFNSLNSQEPRSIELDLVFDYYLKNQLDEAIKLLEDTIPLDLSTKPQLEQIYIRFVAEKAVKSYIKGDKVLFTDCLEKIKNIPKTEESKKLKEEFVQILENMSKLPETVPKKTEAKIPSPSVENIQKILEDFRNQQENYLKKIIPKRFESPQLEIFFETQKKDFKKTIEEFLNQQLKREDKILSYLKSFYPVIIISILIVGILSISVYFLIHYAGVKREKRIVEKLTQYQSFLASQLSQKESLPEGSVTLQSPPPLNTAEKLHGIEIIEAEIVEDFTIGEKMLEHFVNDENTIVKQRAIIAMFKYNPDNAEKKFLEEWENFNEVERLKFLDMLSIVKKPHTLRILIDLVKTRPDPYKRKSLKLLRVIVEKDEEGWIPQEIREIITSYLKEESARLGLVG